MSHSQYHSHSVEVLVKTDGHLVPLRTFRHKGKTLVIGEDGQEYIVRIHNHSASRIEAVCSVDGLDVLDGKSASITKSGYVINPFGFLDIEGFRTSLEKVNLFTFSSVEDAYASRKGKPKSIGVIGVALFNEKFVPTLTVLGERINVHSSPTICTPDCTSIHPDCSSSSTLTTSSSSSRNFDTTVCAFNSSAPISKSAASVLRSASIGTKFGEEAESRVSEVSFTRAGGPFYTFRFHYNSAAGFEAMGIPLPTMTDDEVKDRLNADPFPASPSRKFCQPPR